MPEPREAHSIIEKAEQAVAAGNYAAAEELLREAAALQEQTLGAEHPELANTLNNLGVVCEMAENPIDAEHYFRRAYAIATASLAPDHPFVATSSKNLHDFCAARGRPTELPPSPPTVAAWLDAPAPRAAPPPDRSPSTMTRDESPIPRERSLLPLALGALTVAAVVIGILVLVRPWGSGTAETKAPPATATAPARETPSPRPAPSPREPSAGEQPTAKRTESAADAISARPTAARPTAAPTVVTAQLCTSLRVWRCEGADGPVPPGPMFFFTQVKSATAATIEHRWYQGDRLRQTMKLRIQANPSAGYRTYSRTTISGESGREWRVELRSTDGTVLHEERFTVGSE
jgi:hypothetical protein